MINQIGKWFTTFLRKRSLREHRVETAKRAMIRT
jgi:hypothetical protein